MIQQTDFKGTNWRNAKKSNYEKPLFEEKKELTFPKEIWERFNSGRFCLQCSGCHGCR